MMEKHKRSEWLRRLQKAHTPEEQARVYDHWGLQYEQDVLSSGYNMPEIFVGFINRYVAPGDDPILDVGAGTGILGQSLSIMGYRRIDALDYSCGMLRVCTERYCYRECIRADINDAIPINTDSYQATMVMGLYGMGHAAPETLKEIARVTKPGGFIIYSLREDEYVSEGFKLVEDELVGNGTWRKKDHTDPFNSVPFEKTPIFNTILVFQVI